MYHVMELYLDHSYLVMEQELSHIQVLEKKKLDHHYPGIKFKIICSISQYSVKNTIRLTVCLSFLCRSHLESKLKVFNQYYEGKSGGIRSREVTKNFILCLNLKRYRKTG